MTPPVLHTIIVLAVLIAYTVLTVLGQDGNVLWGILGGQALGGAAQAAGARPKP